MNRRRLATALVSVIVLPLGLAACGSDDGGHGGGGDPEGHNAADVRFTTEMIQHHAQALAMVDLTRQRDLESEVSDLVNGIQEAQAPEIETMTTWLTEWGEEVPSTMRDHVNSGHGTDPGEGMEGMDHGDGEMPGMMTAEQMTELAEAPDADFAELWIEMMIEHHEGAVEMAENQLDDGQYGPAKDLADDVIDTQNAEIDQMKAMLDAS